jgi:hypothetical protein
VPGHRRISNKKDSGSGRFQAANPDRLNNSDSEPPVQRASDTMLDPSGQDEGNKGDGASVTY